jgi:dipeptidyl aminopeptidase/acylaminoacyl peptidase
VQRRTLLGVGACLAGMPSWAAGVTPQARERPDAKLYFKAEQTLGAILAPDGQRLALKSRGAHGRVILSVLELATLKPTVVYSADSADVAEVSWVNAKRLAFSLGDLDTPQGQIDAAPGLFAVDADGQGFRQLVERQWVRVRNGSDTQLLQPWNTFLLGADTSRLSDEVLVMHPETISEKGVDYVRLLRLNTRTARAEQIDAPLHAVAWWSDAQGELRVVMTRQGERSALRWRDPDTGDWQALSQFNSYTEDGDLQVRAVAADGQLYVTARRGRDKQALWRLDPRSRRWSDEPLASSPGFDVDAQILTRQGQVLGWRFNIDAEVTQWIDPAMQALQQHIDKVLPQTVNRLSVPRQADAPWVVIEAFSDQQPSLYYLFNRETRKFVKLGAQRPDIEAARQGRSDLVQVTTRDGRQMPVWWTRPVDAGAAPGPMVVLVHGGPFVRGPDWRWDEEVQFLVARGYQVLQPQFRGTQGFGQAWATAGWRQWGQAMQNDLDDATRWAIQQGHADPARIALAGASYGGYATLMGLIHQPGLYRCGVAWVAVTDLDMLYTVDWSDISDSFKRHGLSALLGDRVQDAARLKAYSPLTHAAALKQPLLLAYGGADKRVPLVHGQSFRKAVQASGAQVQWQVYPDEGHGWRAPATRIDFWDRVARFLDTELAPRAPA